MRDKYTKEEFIIKSNIYHNNKYDYSKVEYINDRTKVCIICKDHGEFWQIPNSHSRSGCYQCGLIKRTNSKRLSINIIELFKEKHGDKYDYSNVNYIKMKSKVEITCLKHDFKFYQMPYLVTYHFFWLLSYHRQTPLLILYKTRLLFLS
jgi:hypothetical protein